jgi:hypothetical protein
MVRTQIQLTEEQAAVLHKMSAERQVSIAELIRNSIDNFVQEEAGTSRAAKVARAKSVVGQFASGHADVSSDHDRYLAEAFQS